MIDLEDPLAGRFRVHVREVLQRAVDDEQVKEPVVDGREGRHRLAGLGIAKGHPQLRHAGAARARGRGDVHSILADAGRGHGHERHAAERTFSGRRGPEVGVHRAPVRIVGIRVADDFDRDSVARVKQRGVAGLPDGNRAVRAEDLDRSRHVRRHERHVVERRFTKLGGDSCPRDPAGRRRQSVLADPFDGAGENRFG